jgi:hypothetical protein
LDKAIDVGFINIEGHKYFNEKTATLLNAVFG